MTTNDAAGVPGGPTAAAPVALGEDDRRDRTRWGPIWAGVLVVLSTYVVLQLLFFALGILDLGFEGDVSTTVASVVSGVLALVAFFLGGLAAAATAFWRAANDGLVHGALVWALSVVAILTLTVLGGGALLGSVASVATQVANVAQETRAMDVDPAQAMQTAREAAGWGVLSLGLSFVAATLGGLIGAKIWPRGRGA
ncbi:hypothetical protein SAMN05421810_101140 [Amycolatopsis arida]|uniref:Uncharacterized protein n=1 Tax=Amycolatopsis arida TaxID=587909 RepID=A0A1I5KGH3_9PSEU|nr:hypothetical protein [Amycolatopsis arida]TDX97036.1 hypothetical protein CLV69_102138 [Amycolatopsis arida]SFO84154.1 hypothetical protein SAMN05421810_101140 [Amycolatopsis arida]